MLDAHKILMEEPLKLRYLFSVIATKKRNSIVPSHFFSLRVEVQKEFQKTLYLWRVTNKTHRVSYYRTFTTMFVEGNMQKINVQTISFFSLNILNQR